MTLECAVLIKNSTRRKKITEEKTTQESHLLQETEIIEFSQNY